MKINIHTGWKKILDDYFNTDNFKKLTDFVRMEYLEKTIYPHPKNIFHAFDTTHFDDVRVIIIGQDPYHNPNQAHGLSFSVQDGIILPPSLKNIYKEIESDLNIKKDFSNGNLESWANQGVLLLNAVLTVQKNNPASHRKKGWEEFTSEVISRISDNHEHCVFLLWGNYAKEKGHAIDKNKHLVLESAHPSPFSAYNGFFGNKHFSQCNQYLKKHSKKPIDW